MKKLFTLIVLALAFSACQTSPKEPTMKDLLQGTWEQTGIETVTFTGNKLESFNTAGTLKATLYFKNNIQDMDKRWWAIFTNAGSITGFYTSGNQMTSGNVLVIPDIKGPLTYTYNKQ